MNIGNDIYVKRLKYKLMSSFSENDVLFVYSRRKIPEKNNIDRNVTQPKQNLNKCWRARKVCGVSAA